MSPSDSADRRDNLARSPAECRRTDALALAGMGVALVLLCLAVLIARLACR